MASTDPLASARQAVFKPGTAEIGRASAQQRQTVGAERFREIATAMLAMPLPSTVGESLALAAEVVASGPRALARSAPQGSSLDASAAIVLRSGLKPDAKIAAVTTLLAGSATPSVADKALAVAYVKGSAWKGGYTLTHLKARVDGSTRPLADELKDAFERLGLGPSVWEDFARLASAELRSVGALRERPRAATQGAAGTPDQTNAKSRMPLNLKLSFVGLPGTRKTAAARLFAGLADKDWDPAQAHNAWFRNAASADFGFNPRADLSRAPATDRNFEALIAHLHATTPRARKERYDLLAEERAAADRLSPGDMSMIGTGVDDASTRTGRPFVDAQTRREIAESIGTQLRELADGAINAVKQK